MNTPTYATYTRLASDEAIRQTVDALKNRNIESVVVDDRAEALATLVGRIPVGAEIFNSQSVSLQEIGFVDYLAQHPNRYRNLRSLVLSQPDPIKRMELRRSISIVDYNVGSVNAVAQSGELVIASHGGSQIAGYAFTARHVIWVVGAQKIVPTLEDAFRRVREHAHPLEDRRITGLEHPQRSRIGKWLIFENEWMAGRVLVILVREPLGF